jgi:uncharacterized membrane protein (DUF373 family)
VARKKQSQEDEEDEEDRQLFADRVLLFLEDAVYWAIALVLVVGSGALIVSQFNTLLRLRDAPAKVVIVDVLDGLLLIFIFVELLYAVRSCLRSHEIVAEPFLIVGILAGIKEIVVLSVEAAALLNKGPEFARPSCCANAVETPPMPVKGPLKNRVQVRDKPDTSARLPGIMAVRPLLRGVVAPARVGGADRWPECLFPASSRC